MSIRVALVDDHDTLRQALREELTRESDITVVGEASDGRGALELAAQLLPDVMLLDIVLPDLTGMEVARQLYQSYPAIRTVAVSMHPERHFVVAMLDAGSLGYVCKTSGTAELLLGIRAAAEGRRYLCPEAAKAFTTQSDSRPHSH